MRRHLLVALAITVGSSAANPAAQGPQLVADVNTTATGDMLARHYGYPGVAAAGSHVLTVGAVAYFSADDGIHGVELWRTDGSAEGTFLVADLCPGSCASLPGELTAVAGALVFTADDGVHGRELWRASGTDVHLVADIEPGLDASSPQGLVAALGGVFFSASTAALGRELWRSDGTAAGTRLVFDLASGPMGSTPVVRGANSRGLFFTAVVPTGFPGLWFTDGTPALLVSLHDPSLPSALALGEHGMAGERLVWVDDNNFRVTGSDGTAAGTAALPLAPGWVLSRAALGDRLFIARPEELWVTDGTPAGTTLVGQPPIPAGARPPAATVGARLYLAASDDIWASDGTPGGTAEAFANGARVNALTSLEGRLLLFLQGAGGIEPWISDGTGEGTVLLADVATGPASSYDPQQPGTHELAQLPGGAVARLFDDTGDLELWRLTTAGAAQLKEVNSQASSIAVGWNGDAARLRPFAALGDALLFAADQGSGGVQPWRTDGTAAGTAMVADLGSGLYGDTADQMTPLPETITFLGPDRRLWRTTSDLGSVSLLSWESVDVPSRAGRNLFFASGATHRLWVSDGTPAGTRPIDNAGVVYCCPTTWPSLGDRLAFVGVGLFPQVWLSDGSVEGTAPVDGSPYVESPYAMIAVGDRLFFAGSDDAGRELWVVANGVARRVRDVRAGAASAIATPLGDFVPPRSTPEKLAAAGGRAVMLADDGVHGEEPWGSDGTSEGTVLLADLFPGDRSSRPTWLTTAGRRAYWAADDGVHGRELWTTDGTPEGTRLVLDIVPGSGSSLPRNLQAIGDHLVFSANDPVHGTEAWATDGTPEGTRRLTDVAPGPLAASPLGFTAGATKLYFAANDNETGFEVWTLPLTSVASSPSHFFTVTPCRLLDSRGRGGIGASPLRVEVAGRCGVPPTARAIAANVTVVAAATAGGVHVGAGFSPPSPFPLVDFRPGVTRAHQSVLRLGYGHLDVRATLPAGGHVHVLVDVTGWFE